MIKTFKKNPALYIGLALPLLMLLILGGIPFIASYLVSAPTYNMIFSVRNYQAEGKLGVVDGKLQLEVYNRSNYVIDTPSVYLLDVHSGKSTLLNSPLKNKNEAQIPAHDTRIIVFGEVHIKQLDRSQTAPDGYQVMKEDNDNLFLFPFFFGGTKRNTISISNSGRVVKYQLPLENYWGAKFEGWVIP